MKHRRESIYCHADGTQSYLEQRSWALQEFILSRRTIHFTSNELIWNRQDLRTCECLRRLPRKEAEKNWEALVENFTSRDITYAADCLPALSGLAVATGLPSSDYLAGIWRRDLNKRLLWVSESGVIPFTIIGFEITRPEKTSRRHPTYYAPSWFWASRIGKFDSLRTGAVFDILEVTCIPATANAYGRASAGHIKIRGQLCEVKQLRSEYLRTTVIGTSGHILSYLWPDVTSDDHELNDPTSAYFALFSKPDRRGFYVVLFLRRRHPDVKTLKRVGLGYYDQAQRRIREEILLEEVVTIV
jgi:hypothetical protein